MLPVWSNPQTQSCCNKVACMSVFPCLKTLFQYILTYQFLGIYCLERKKNEWNILPAFFFHVYLFIDNFNSLNS